MVDSLESAGLAPERLVLEITETAMMTDLEPALAKLHELRAIGVQATAAGSQLVVLGPGGPTNLFISWNCIGWQSLVLLGLSMYVGLRSQSLREAQAQVVLVGILGTVLVNLLRVTIVCLLAATAGRWPAVIFHDYGGTLMTITWLFAYWTGAQRWLL